MSRSWAGSGKGTASGLWWRRTCHWRPSGVCRVTAFDAGRQPDGLPALSKRFTTRRKLTDKSRVKQELLPQDPFFRWSIGSPSGRMAASKRFDKPAMRQSQLHTRLPRVCAVGSASFAPLTGFPSAAPDRRGAERRHARTAQVRQAVRDAAPVRSGRRRAWGQAVLPLTARRRTGPSGGSQADWAFGRARRRCARSNTSGCLSMDPRRPTDPGHGGRRARRCPPPMFSRDRSAKRVGVPGVGVIRRSE
ncbi:hypothetical protein BX281_10135 [Streptomyces sp. Ag82_O1-15]|nr:hypothetical protein BX281_10135 [Streptomyces sp. Ag82_O1-15]